MQKDLNDPDNHDGVIIHLKPDILESEVKWALGSITANKISGGDGIPVELFQILKDDDIKVLHSRCQQIWKLHRGHKTGKSQFSSQPHKVSVSRSVVDCSPPGSSVHEIFQARILEWLPFPPPKAMPKIVITTEQFHSSHKQAK